MTGYRSKGIDTGKENSFKAIAKEIFLTIHDRQRWLFKQ